MKKPRQKVRGGFASELLRLSWSCALLQWGAKQGLGCPSMACDIRSAAQRGSSLPYL